MAFVIYDENGDAAFDLQNLLRTVRLSARIGLRQTNVHFDLPEWDRVQKRDRLTGVGLCGVVDFMDALGFNSDDLIYVLREMREAAEDEARQYAKEMRVPEPLLVTTIKPGGTIPKLPGVSSGVHRARAPYYIRRVRITASDPLARVMLDAGYPIYPENNSNGPTVAQYDAMSSYEKWEVLQKATTWVIEFPMQSATTIGSAEESALDQFSRYLLFQKYWTDHNTSITIEFAPNEVEPLIDMILEHWDSYVAVSFLPKNTAAYPLLPEEPITQDEYQARVNAITGIDYLQINKMLREYEHVDMSTEILDPSCETGVCPIR